VVSEVRSWLRFKEGSFLAIVLPAHEFGVAQLVVVHLAVHALFAIVDSLKEANARLSELAQRWRLWP
jgi:hypothetical protein